jgi:peptidoglycan/xylan/chitin deacetylase (PgdA/CDA1 family)
MNNVQNAPGTFLLSFDTELAWGHYDCFRPELFSPDGSRERRAVDGILDLLDEFGIVATWAFVGHLFYGSCDECERCPVQAWQDRYPAFAAVYETNHPLWYGPDLLERVRARQLPHEIAFHGYTHRPFNETSMGREEARMEIQEWLRLAERLQIRPETVIFPRNQIGHLDLFREAGFVCYRGVEAMPAYYQAPIIGRVLRRLYYYVAAATLPPRYTPQIDETGLANLPSSRWIFGFNRRGDQLLDALNLSTLRLRKMAAGIHAAAREGKMIHLWAHPYEFRTQKDLDRLRYLLGHVAEEIVAGRMRTISMVELSKSLLEQQTDQNFADREIERG